MILVLTQIAKCAAPGCEHRVSITPSQQRLMLANPGLRALCDECTAAFERRDPRLIRSLLYSKE